MNYDSPTKDKNAYGKPLTKNYYYFDRLSMSQQGLIYFEQQGK